MPIFVDLLKFGKRIRDLIWSGFARPNGRILRYVGERGQGENRNEKLDGNRQ